MRSLPYLILCLILNLISSMANAQVFTDHFQDSVLSSAWTGNTTSFKINSRHQLQLNAAVSGSSNLSQRSLNSNSIRWEFWIHLPFQPSSKSFARIYLSSNQSDLGKPLNGYFIQLGQAGAGDGIDLYRQDTSRLTKIMSGKAGHAGKSSNTLRILVTRDVTGLFSVYSDTLGGFFFYKEGTTRDTRYAPDNYFGLGCTYSAGYADQFFFDDIAVSNYTPDAIPPKVVSAQIIDTQHIGLRFNETVRKSVLISKGSYFLNQGYGLPDSVILISPQEVSLYWKSPLKSGKYYTLIYSKAEDIYGNVNPFDSIRVSNPATTGLEGVVINEIYADTLPSYGLPFAEYVELYNSGNSPIKLSDLILRDAVSSAPLPDSIIPPRQYIVLTSERNARKFKGIAPAIGLAKFPGLNNDGDTISITDRFGRVIDQMHYSLKSYRDPKKAGGGYALERIVIQDSCHQGGDENFAASMDSSGGTPGRSNSWSGKRYDSITPRLGSVRMQSPQKAVLIFNESLAIQTLRISFPPNFTIDSITPGSSDKSFELYFSPALASGQSIVAAITTGCDCAGNYFPAPISLKLEWYQTSPATAGDIIISEIMSNPASGQAKYVELYNRSSAHINLSGMRLQSGASFAILPDAILPAGEFIVCLQDTEQRKYPDSLRKAGLSSLSMLSTSRDTIELYDSSGHLMHWFEYNGSDLSDANKRLGGFSYELQSADQYFVHQNNTDFSHSTSGGSPSYAIWHHIPDDVNPPYLYELNLIDSVRLRFAFSEAIDTLSVLNNLRLDANTIESIIFNHQDRHRGIIRLQKPVESNQMSTLYLQKCRDLSSNTMADEEVPIGHGLSADSTDLVINEIMYHPESGKPEYIELYNRSLKVISSDGLYINRQAKNSPDISALIFPEARQIFPKDYIVLTGNKRGLISAYTHVEPLKVIEVPSWPALYNTEKVSIYSRNIHKNIDALAYSDKMQYPLLTRSQGIALERISPEEATQDNSNWSSASESAGYATPTQENSQHHEHKSVDSGIDLALESDYISPDQDGDHDQLFLKYHTDKAGYLLRFKVFSSGGMELYSTPQPHLLGNESQISWNGLDNRNALIPAGVYILYCTLIHPDGTSIERKFSFSIVRK